jgi:hypothetical protein
MKERYQQIINPHSDRVEAFDLIVGLDQNKKWHIEVVEWEPPKTEKQTGYLEEVVYPTIAEESGHDVDELRAYYYARFLPKKVITVFAEECYENGTLSDFGRHTTSYFITQVIAHANTELGIKIPDPDKNWKLNRKRK